MFTIDKISSLIRFYILLLFDISASTFSFISAFILIYNFNIVFELPKQLFVLLLCTTTVRIVCFYKHGLYNFLWRYASTKEFTNIIKASSVSALIILSLHYFMFTRYISIKLLILDITLNLLFVGGIRVLLRIFRDYLRKKESLINVTSDIQKTNIIIVGAGDAGDMICREIKRNPNLGYNVIGFVDDKPSKIGQTIHQSPILGALQKLPSLIQEYHIQEILIAMPSAPGKLIRDLISMCEDTQIKFKTTPKLSDIIGGKIRIDQIRDVRIEDLLRREENQLDPNGISNYLSSQVILITGAGGSIGSELCRQIIKFSPKKLILVDHDENATYEINMELNQTPNNSTHIIPYVTDIKNKNRLSLIFDDYKPDVVFHAAAHKHVPLMEQNVIDVIENNVTGVYNLIDLSEQYNVKNFIFISTDKAVLPQSCMGATKRLGEILIQTYSQFSTTKFSAVRFGNVLGSQGSVIPLFKKQIRQGGPITITHPDMKRYFMTIQEAVSLVLQTGALSEGGEIFILDMGSPVKILDLARDLIRLSGLKEGADIDINISGIRPGEKLFEELYFNPKKLKKTIHKKIFISQPEEFDKESVLKEIKTLGLMTLQTPQSELKTKLLKLCASSISPTTTSSIKQDIH